MTAGSGRERAREFVSPEKRTRIFGQSDPFLKLLFVCSRNQKRSLTAEQSFRGDQRFVVRSAGTEPSARRRVTQGDLGWADAVLVMEKKHAAYLRERFPEEMWGKHVVIMAIPDEYDCGDPDLITMLKSRVEEEFGATTDSTMGENQDGSPDV